MPDTEGHCEGYQLPLEQIRTHPQCHGDRNSCKLEARTWSSNQQINEFLIEERENFSSHWPDIVGQLSQQVAEL